mgnify:CR=1 FL=1
MSVRILNANLLSITRIELLQSLKRGVLVTPNLDHLVKLQHDREFYDLYQKAEWVVCDSKILYLCSRLLKKGIPEAIPGSSFFMAFYQYHKDNPDCRIFLLGAMEGVAQKAMERINASVGREIVVGAMSPSYGFENKPEENELIESVIMQIPLPLIYLAENEDGKLVVVDGRQRLTTFFQFLDNEFRLKDLKILPQINGMNFNELEESHLYSRYVTIIEDTQLVVQIIKYPTKDRVRFDIFDRVNRGGTPLNKQEMRNALYQGNATKLLDELSKMKSFKDATGGAISPKHMKDKYVILRALCFYLLWRGNILDKNKKRMEYRSQYRSGKRCSGNHH